MDSTRPIRALMRGLDALTFLNSQDGATVSEVAHEIRLPRTTVYRILETLCDSGFAFRDQSDERYRLTIRVRGLSAGFDDEAWVSRIAKPIMQALGEELTWPLHLATLSGAQMRIREATDQQTPFAIDRYVPGMQMPLLSTSTGRVYLAFCPAAQSDAIIEGLARSGGDEERMAKQKPELRRLLADIKAQGYASTARSRRMIEELTLSVPVPLSERSLAVLTLRFVASAIPLKVGVERFLPKLRQCAAKISSTFLEKQAEAHAKSTPKTAA